MRNYTIGFILLVLVVVISGCGVLGNSEKKKIDNEIMYIEKLGELKEKGLLTEEEYDMKKKEILGLEGSEE